MKKGTLFIFVIILLVSGISQTTASAQQIYWCEGGWGAGELYRAELDGSNKQQLFTSNSESFSVVQLDIGAEKIYWTGDDKVRRANLNGTNVEELFVGSFFSEGLALDIGSNKIYWTDYDGIIRRANLDGANPEIIHDRVGVTYGLALDVFNQQMYWGDSGRSTKTIWTSNFDGTGAGYLLDGGDEPLGIALDLTTEKIYWADWQGKKVWRANMNGTNSEVLYTTTDGNSIGIAIDTITGKMYWSESTSRRILRANLDGSDVEVLFTTVNVPWGLAITPEPATLLLLGLGAVMVRRRY